MTDLNFSLYQFEKNLSHRILKIHTLKIIYPLTQETEFDQTLAAACTALENYPTLNKKGVTILTLEGNYYHLFINLHENFAFFGTHNLNYETSVAKNSPELFSTVLSFRNQFEEIQTYQSIPDILMTYPHSQQLTQLELDAQTKPLFLQTKANIAKHIQSYQPSWLESLLSFSLGLICDYETLRIQLLKFIAVVSTLSFDKTGQELHKSFLEAATQICQSKGKLPWAIKPLFSLSKIASQCMPKTLFKKIVEFSISLTAKKFICSEDLKEVKKIIHSLHKTNRNCTLDQLGELVISREEADFYCHKIVSLIQAVDVFETPEKKNRAQILTHHISIKTSALSANFIEDPDAFTFVYNDIKPRLLEIFTAAQKHNVFLNFDAEHFSYRNLTPKLIFHFLEQHDAFQGFAHFGFVVQAYLKDSQQHLDDLKNDVLKRNHYIPIRLVKGAYWDGETIEAAVKNFSSPQFLNKVETDIQYRQLMHSILKEKEVFQLCVASHNVDDHCYAETIRTIYYPKALPIEHQTLHMTYEPLSVACAKMGWAIRNYLPTGSLLMGMGYLVRRIMENASQTGVLTAIRKKKFPNEDVSPLQTLLKNIEKNQYQTELAATIKKDTFAPTSVSRLFTAADLKALHHNTLPLPIQQIPNAEIQIFSKCLNHELIGSFHSTSPHEVALAVQQAHDAFLSQEKPNIIERSQLLLKAALLLKLQKYLFTQLIIKEAGKTRAEALGDVDEAIDFMNYYAHEVRKQSNHAYCPLGVVAIIAPWNFPLAILCGMTSAALATGNMVIIKPAEQTTFVAMKFHQLLQQAGFRKKEVTLLPGLGEITGNALLQNPLVRGIAFTGSKTVGTMIYQTSLTISGKFNPYYRRVIAEMGGKNAVIVCKDAEIDLAITSIIYSAFAHAGQKCSACSRIIIQEEIFEVFAKRFAARTAELVVDTPENAATFINPLISKEEVTKSKKNIQTMLALAQEYQEKIWFNGSENSSEACINPVIIEANQKSLQASHHLVFHELFAPLIYLIPFTTHQMAVQVFNQTSYALTGGVFTQSEENIKFYLQHLKAGNLYINRNITGARVAIEPFGGFKLSGTGPKAGGATYLQAFQKANVQLIPLQPNLTNTSIILQQASVTEWAKKVFNISINLSQTAISKENLYEISGQINYLDYQIKKEFILFILDTVTVCDSFLKLLCLTHHENIPYRVICTQADVLTLFQNSPFYLNIIKTHNPQEIEIHSIDLELIIYQLSPENRENHLQPFTDKKYYQQHILQFLDCQQLPSNSPLQELGKHLSATRTIAINTMRYGAPFETEKTN